MLRRFIEVVKKYLPYSVQIFIQICRDNYGEIKQGYFQDSGYESLSEKMDRLTQVVESLSEKIDRLTQAEEMLTRNLYDLQKKIDEVYYYTGILRRADWIRKQNIKNTICPLQQELKLSLILLYRLLHRNQSRDIKKTLTDISFSFSYSFSEMILIKFHI